MTLSMDARLASDTARYGFVFARRGIVPEVASSWFLPRLVGIAAATDWCYSGRLIDAAEAHEKGLVPSVHKPDQRVDAHIANARDLPEPSARAAVGLSPQLAWARPRPPPPPAGHPRGPQAHLP